MANGYIRQSTGVIINGGTINASDSNNEFNALQSAFDVTTGHTHDGTTGGGAKVPVAGLANLAGLSVIGNSTNASTTPAAITGTDGQVLAVVGTTLGFVGTLSSLIFSTGITLGVAGTATGALSLKGTTSGTVVVQPQAVAGAYNFNLPITAGTSGYVLTSAGGGSSPMTWTQLIAGNISGLATSATTDTTNAANISSGLLSPARGGTGVSNGTSTITIGGNVTVSGAFTLGLTVTANTALTLPTSGTLVSRGSLTSGNVPKADANGNLVDTTLVASHVMQDNVTTALSVGYTLTPYSGGTVSSGTYTPAAANGNYQYYTNNGAHTLANPAADSAIDILITNGASAGAITFSGFTVSNNTGDTLTTTNTNKFIISIRRINSISTYTIKALQ